MPSADLSDALSKGSIPEHEEKSKKDVPKETQQPSKKEFKKKDKEETVIRKFQHTNTLNHFFKHS
jgi:hypothetical protein